MFVESDRNRDSKPQRGDTCRSSGAFDTRVELYSTNISLLRSLRWLGALIRLREDPSVEIH
jgi:hypothetical protein